MSRLYDRIMASSHRITKGWHGKPIISDDLNADIVRGSTVIVADDAMNYLIRQTDPNDPDHKWNKYPCCAPIANRMFIEVDGERSPLPRAWGCQITSFDLRDDDQHQRFKSLFPLEESGKYGAIEDKRWFYCMSIYSEIRAGFAYGPIYLIGQFVYPDGRFAQEHSWDLGYDLALMQTVDSLYPGHGNDIDHARAAMHLLMRPIGFALSLMNSKNVELIDKAPLAGVSRKYERKTGEPLVKYKIVKVNPMRTVNHPVPPISKIKALPLEVPNTPLHEVRGHFKDYRDGKGLFGKLKGVYWWEQNVRGTVEHGITIKDYEVQEPRESAQTD